MSVWVLAWLNFFAGFHLRAQWSVDDSFVDTGTTKPAEQVAHDLAPRGRPRFPGPLLIKQRTRSTMNSQQQEQDTTAAILTMWGKSRDSYTDH
jgi:hypothetical protein